MIETLILLNNNFCEVNSHEHESKKKTFSTPPSQKRIKIIKNPRFIEDGIKTCDKERVN